MRLSHSQWNQIADSIHNAELKVKELITQNQTTLTGWRIAKCWIAPHPPTIELTFVHKPIEGRKNNSLVVESGEYPLYLLDEELSGLNNFLCDLCEQMKERGLTLQLDESNKNQVKIRGEVYSSGKVHYKIRPKDYLTFWKSIQQ